MIPEYEGDRVLKRAGPLSASLHRLMQNELLLLYDRRSDTTASLRS